MPFWGNRSISHSGFNLYWPSGTHGRNDNRDLIAVRKDLLDKTIVKNRTDLVSHSYGMVLDSTEGQILTKGLK